MLSPSVHPVTGESLTSGVSLWRPVHPGVMDVICAEGTFAGADYHMHEAVQVVIPTSDLEIRAGASTMVLKPGMIYFTAPLELRAMRGVDCATFSARMLLVPPASVSSLQSDDLVVDDGNLQARLARIFEELSRPLVDLDSVTRLRKCLADLSGSSAVGGYETRHKCPALRVARARQHLCTHPVEHVSLSALAQRAGLSKSHLIRTFVRTYGVTPHAYHMQLRLARARRLLAEGLPLSRVTYDAGFADQSHLTRRFAAFHRLTPARFARALAAPVPGARQPQS
jgi:AraC-like DNA-binding protein